MPGDRRSLVITPAGRSLVAIVFGALVLFGLVVVPDLVHRQILGLGAADIHNAAFLPDRISVCGRNWTKDALGRQVTEAQIVAVYGVGPTLVDPGLFAPCPPGPCKRVAQDGPCDTVVFVRVGDDAYLDYSLVGGP
jgi:hypothetical protein